MNIPVGSTVLVTWARRPEFKGTLWRLVEYTPFGVPTVSPVCARARELSELHHHRNSPNGTGYFSEQFFTLAADSLFLVEEA
jgi:hypothetical protein